MESPLWRNRKNMFVTQRVKGPGTQENKLSAKIGSRNLDFCFFRPIRS